MVWQNFLKHLEPRKEKEKNSSSPCRLVPCWGILQCSAGPFTTLPYPSLLFLGDWFSHRWGLFWTFVQPWSCAWSSWFPGIYGSFKNPLFFHVSLFPISSSEAFGSIHCLSQVSSVASVCCGQCFCLEMLLLWNTFCKCYLRCCRSPRDALDWSKERQALKSVLQGAARQVKKLTTILWE